MHRAAQLAAACVEGEDLIRQLKQFVSIVTILFARQVYAANSIQCRHQYSVACLVNGGNITVSLFLPLSSSTA